MFQLALFLFCFPEVLFVLPIILPCIYALSFIDNTGILPGFMEAVVNLTNAIIMPVDMTMKAIDSVASMVLP